MHLNVGNNPYWFVQNEIHELLDGFRTRLTKVLERFLVFCKAQHVSQRHLAHLIDLYDFIIIQYETNLWLWITEESSQFFKELHRKRSDKIVIGSLIDRYCWASYHS